MAKGTLYIHLGAVAEQKVEAGLSKPEDLVDQNFLALAADVECATCAPDVHLKEVFPGVWLMEIGHDDDCTEWKQRQNRRAGRANQN